MVQVSIVTVNKDNCCGLKRTAESISSQTFSEYEWIVIDAVSSDDSVNIIKKYAPYISYWCSEPDNGIYDGMNKGIKHCHGEYVLFLNSGDTFVDEYVLADIQKLDLCADIIVGKINFVDANGVFHKAFQKKMKSVSLLSFLRNGIPHQSALIKRDLFEKYGLYNLKYRIVADWAFFLNVIVFNNASLKYCDVIVANFDGTGLTSKHGKKMMAEIDLALKDHLPYNIYKDYKNIIDNNSDFLRTEWLIKHTKYNWIVRKLVGFGRFFIYEKN